MSNVNAMVPSVLTALVVGSLACSSDAVTPDAGGADSGIDASPDGGGDIDADATVTEVTVPTQAHPSPRARALFTLLAAEERAPRALFGQQHAPWEGHDGPYATFDTDVRRSLEASGASSPDHPAIFGWNYESYVAAKPDVRAAMQKRIVLGDARGAITTIHWPMGNFAIDCAPKRCGDNDNQQGVDPVHMIATNAPFVDPRDGKTRGAADVFDELVDELATFLATLQRDGAAIPVILRPFHEMNGKGGATAHWWAGRDPGEYRKMWRRLVDRLRDTRGLTQVLFAFSPKGEALFSGGQDPTAAYLKYWPEDDPSTTAGRYVDVAGFDTYLSDSDPAQPLFDAIDVVHAFAHASVRSVARVVAIAEVGRKDGTGAPSDGGPVDYTGGPFWTERILPGLDADAGARWRKIAYFMTWTNGTFSTYPGAPTAQSLDFRKLFDHPASAFLADVATF